jgi:hypothetical protein
LVEKETRADDTAPPGFAESDGKSGNGCRALESRAEYRESVEILEEKRAVDVDDIACACACACVHVGPGNPRQKLGRFVGAVVSIEP